MQKITTLARLIAALLGATSSIVIILKNTETTFHDLLGRIVGNSFLIKIQEYGVEISVSFAVLIIILHYVGRIREMRRWTAISSHYNIIHGNYQDINLMSTRNKKLARDELGKFYDVFLNQISAICQYYTGDECGVCFKTFNPENNSISTEIRCTKSKSERQNNDVGELSQFQYNENTAFSHIIDGKNGHFCGDYLKFKAITGAYKNKNKKWNEHYNSTIVVPVTLERDPSKFSKYNIYGFICIDSKRMAICDVIIINMLKQAAMMWCSLLSRLVPIK